MTQIACPQFTELDQEIIEDFCSCLQENVDSIDRCLDQLDQEVEEELVHQLFRDMHSLKGNCRMVFLDPLVEITHAMEEIVSDMRQQQRSYIPLYGEFFMGVILRLQGMIRQLVEQGGIPSERKDGMLALIEIVRDSNDTDAEAALNKALDQLAADDGSANGLLSKSKTIAEPVADVAPVSGEKTEKDLQQDLAFFKKIALQLDELNIYRKKRTATILELSLATNEQMGQVVDPVQLTAAVYLHDFGMALVPSRVVDKPLSLTAEEVAMIQGHVDMGAGMLERIGGWEDAVRMVRQHHERYDGSGYPAHLKNSDIEPGAMIIALADTFYAVTNERVDRSYKKSLFSAVTLINGESGRQFAPDFVDAFNEIVRNQYIAKSAS